RTSYRRGDGPGARLRNVPRPARNALLCRPGHSRVRLRTRPADRVPRTQRVRADRQHHRVCDDLRAHGTGTARLTHNTHRTRSYISRLSRCSTPVNRNGSAAPHPKLSFYSERLASYGSRTGWTTRT